MSHGATSRRTGRRLFTQQSDGASASKPSTDTGSVIATGDTQVTRTKGGLESYLTRACKRDAGRKNRHRSFKARSSPSPTSQHLPRRLWDNASKRKAGHWPRPPRNHLAPKRSLASVICISHSSLFIILSPAKPSPPSRHKGIMAGQFLRQVHHRSR